MSFTLSKINKEDLIFTADDDKVSTLLTLDDYYWMEYQLSATLNLTSGVTLCIKFVFAGTINSEMHVEYHEGSKVFEWRYYSFSTDVFEKYITRYMDEHIKSWDNGSSFNGGDIALEFYNEVVDLVQG